MTQGGGDGGAGGRDDADAPLLPASSSENELRDALEDCLADDHPLALLELISTMI